jgi:hypothetical protein
MWFCIVLKSGTSIPGESAAWIFRVGSCTLKGEEELSYEVPSFRWK